MDITVYLPEAIGSEGKQLKLPFSRLLRRAVETELERRAMMAKTLEKGHEIFEFDELQTAEGGQYTGRLTGIKLAPEVFLTDDGRVFVHDSEIRRLHEIPDPVEGLREWLGGDDYIHAVNALGIKPVVDV